MYPYITVKILDLKQHKAILYLAAGSTNAEAAEAVGVSLSALEKWKKQKEFKDLLQEAIQAVFHAGIAELTKGSIEAARELRRIATDPEVGDRIKVSAITAMFSQIEKFQSWQLEERLAKLETKLDGTNTEQD